MYLKAITQRVIVCIIILIICVSIFNINSVNAKEIPYIFNISTKYNYDLESHLNFKKVKELNKLYCQNLKSISYDDGQREHVISITPHAKQISRICNQYLMKNLNKFNLKQLSYVYDNLILMNSYSLRNISNRLSRIRTKKIKAINKVSKLSKQDNKFDTELRNYLVNDINRTRIQYGRKPLIVDNLMQQVANYRAEKVLYAYEHPNNCLKYEHISQAKLNSLGGSTDNWIHGDDTHTSGGDYLLRHGYDPNKWSANAGATFYNQKYSSNYADVSYKYLSNTPKHIAYNINDDYINNDDFYPEFNGHQKSELDSHAKYLGVGIAYDPQAKLFADNEQYYD